MYYNEISYYFFNGILRELKNCYPFKHIKIKPTHKAGLSQFV